MLTTVVVTLLAAALVASLVVAYLALRAARSATSVAEVDAHLREALDHQAAMLAQQAAQLEARLGSEREHTVVAAADMAAKLASEKLGDTLAHGSRELDLRASTFDDRVAGLTEALGRMGTVVSQLQADSARHHGELLHGLAEARTSTRALTETTQALREALASPKARGQWGERMADDVLRLAGMVEGVNYLKQTAVDGGGIPDVTFLLPGGRVLHMDVKFPVDNYLRHLEATSDADRASTAKAFLRDVRNRVKELSGRGYVHADTTLDEVLLFIPNESVWTFIHEHDPQLIDVALGQRVVLCSPVSLFAVLAVVRRAVEQARLERTSDEILTCLAEFRRQWEKYADAVDVVEKRLASTQRGFEELTGPRRRMLERQLDRIDALRDQRGLTEALPALGDGEGEVARRATGDVRPLGTAAS